MATLSNITKNSGTLGNFRKESLIDYLFTDALDYILAGENEDQIILIKEADTLSGSTKHSGSLTNILKH